MTIFADADVSSDEDCESSGGNSVDEADSDDDSAPPTAQSLPTLDDGPVKPVTWLKTGVCLPAAQLKPKSGIKGAGGEVTFATGGNIQEADDRGSPKIQTKKSLTRGSLKKGKSSDMCNAAMAAVPECLRQRVPAEEKRRTLAWTIKQGQAQQRSSVLDVTSGHCVMATGEDLIAPSNVGRKSMTLDAASEAGKIRHETREKLQRNRKSVVGVAPLRRGGAIDTKNLEAEAVTTGLMGRMLSMDGIDVPTSAKAARSAKLKATVEQEVMTYAQDLGDRLNTMRMHRQHHTNDAEAMKKYLAELRICT
jgi:hypothetical protein